jgi:CRP-like cAMP-binding protein
VQERGAPAEYIQVLVSGRFRLEEADGAPAEILTPPAMLGIQEVLKGTALRGSAVAETESIALVMPAEEFRTLLAANIELAQGLFRMLLEPGNGDGPVGSVARPKRSFRFEPREAPLSTVEKVMYLQTLPILSHATADELYEVAAISREIALVDLETLYTAGSPAAIVLLLSGAVELSSDNGTESAGSGDCLGVRETLAGGSFLETARIVSGGTALQIDREPLFDLLADRMDLLQGVFSAVFHRQGEGPVGSR